MTHEERVVNIPRGERGGRKCLDKKYTEGNARQRWIKVVDGECREARQSGEVYHNLVADAESRTAAHNRGAPKREPACGAIYEGHMLKNKLVCEGYSDECVVCDWELSYGKLQHLMACNEQWASYPENKRKGMERHHKGHEERCGSNDREVKE